MSENEKWQAEIAAAVVASAQVFLGNAKVDEIARNSRLAGEDATLALARAVREWAEAHPVVPHGECPHKAEAEAARGVRERIEALLTRPATVSGLPSPYREQVEAALRQVQDYLRSALGASDDARPAMVRCLGCREVYPAALDACPKCGDTLRARPPTTDAPTTDAPPGHYDDAMSRRVWLDPMTASPAPTTESETTDEGNDGGKR